jgi:hypothetical protein
MKSSTIFTKSVMILTAIDYLIMIYELITKYYAPHPASYFFWIGPFFFCSVLLLPALLLVIFFMPWREQWLKLRWRLTLCFFLDLLFVWFMLAHYAD